MRYFIFISFFFLIPIKVRAYYPNYYAAIAYSPSTNSWGVANNQYSPAVANNTARSWCTGYDCYSGVVQNGCIALATSYRGFGFGSGWNSQVAYYNALSYCQQYSGVSCGLLVWQCTAGHN